MAEFHDATSLIEGLPQRPGWRRIEEILSDPEVDLLLADNEAHRSEEIRIVRWHLDRARRIAAPGCNASAVSLALAPAVAAGLVEQTDVGAVLAVGPSGAGRVLRPDLSASELLGSANAYAVADGSHTILPAIVTPFAATTVNVLVIVPPVIVRLAAA